MKAQNIRWFIFFLLYTLAIGYMVYVNYLNILLGICGIGLGIIYMLAAITDKE